MAKLFFVNNKKGWAGDAFNKIVTTINGYDWGTQYSPLFTSYNVSFVDTLRGWAGYSGLVHTTDGGGPIVSVNPAGTEIPENYVLYQNYPNPFNQLTIINYQLPMETAIEIKVFDITGKEVQMLVNERKQAGAYKISFDAGKLPSGVYFYAMYADGKRMDAKRMILTK
jgi:hypothetical protein